MMKNTSLDLILDCIPSGLLITTGKDADSAAEVRVKVRGSSNWGRFAAKSGSSGLSRGPSALSNDFTGAGRT